VFLIYGSVNRQQARTAGKAPAQDGKTTVINIWKTIRRKPCKEE
jgi:hypothetical protein